MKYSILIETKAKKEASKIPSKFRTRIDQVITSLASEPRKRGSKKLTNKEGYRIRVGEYRILYTIDDEAMAIVIYRIKARGEATYK